MKLFAWLFGNILLAIELASVGGYVLLSWLITVDPLINGKTIYKTSVEFPKLVRDVACGALSAIDTGVQLFFNIMSLPHIEEVASIVLTELLQLKSTLRTIILRHFLNLNTGCAGSQHVENVREDWILAVALVVPALAALLATLGMLLPGLVRRVQYWHAVLLLTFAQTVYIHILADLPQMFLYLVVPNSTYTYSYTPLGKAMLTCQCLQMLCCIALMYIHTIREANAKREKAAALNKHSPSKTLLERLVAISLHVGLWLAVAGIFLWIAGLTSSHPSPLRSGVQVRKRENDRPGWMDPTPSPAERIRKLTSKLVTKIGRSAAAGVLIAVYIAPVLEDELGGFEIDVGVTSVDVFDVIGGGFELLKDLLMTALDLAGPLAIQAIDAAIGSIPGTGGLGFSAAYDVAVEGISVLSSIEVSFSLTPPTLAIQWNRIPTRIIVALFFIVLTFIAVRIAKIATELTSEDDDEDTADTSPVAIALGPLDRMCSGVMQMGMLGVISALFYLKTILEKVLDYEIVTQDGQSVLAPSAYCYVVGSLLIVLSSFALTKGARRDKFKTKQSQQHKYQVIRSS